MDPVTLGMAKADARKKYASNIPALIGHYVAADLAGAHGSPVTVWEDRSPNALHVTASTPTGAPTVRTDSGRYLRTSASVALGKGGGDDFLASQVGGYAKPVSFAAVIRLPSAGSGAARYIAGTSSMALGIQGATGQAHINSGAVVGTGGPNLNDDQWHIVVGVNAPSSGATWVDGYLNGATASNAGTGILNGFYIGAAGGGAPGNMAGDIKEIMVSAAMWTPEQVEIITQKLAASHGIPVGPASTLPLFTDVVLSTGDNARVWVPPSVRKGDDGTAPVILWAHPHGQNEQIVPGYFAYPLIAAAYNEGWPVIGFRGHGDKWGNSTALEDLAAAHSYITTNYGARPVILAGASMGGMTAANALVHASVPNIVGAFTVDGVVNLSALYANATYTASIKAAFGIAGDGSDYATKTAGFDPTVRPIADFGSTPWRFFASAADVSVSKSANSDQFAARITNARERAVVTHGGAHLQTTGVLPADMVAFVKRCIAAV